MPQKYHKTKTNGRTRQLSRHLMEQHLGRPLARNEIVHHKNHDKLDDRLENYELTTPKAHAQHHNQKHPITKKCAVCGGEFTPHPTKRATKVTCSRKCLRERLSLWARAQMASGPAPGAKLTADQVASIRSAAASSDVSMRELARRFGVHHGTVSAIVRGKSWNGVPS